MQTMTVYRYIRADGGVSVSPDKPEGEYTELTRIIADEGKLLKLANGDYAGSIDTADASGITEVDEAIVNSRLEELAARQDEAEAALMELAQAQSDAEERADEADAALIELASMVTEE